MEKKELFVTGNLINERYFINSLIATGGIGKTYLCNDQQTGNKVVLKVLRFNEAEDWKIVELFEREAEILKKIDHPNIPFYIDYFKIEEKNELYMVIVQQYVDGNNLEDLIQKGASFTEKHVIDIFRDLLNILEYLHSMNPPVIHRDVNPKNIIIDRNDKVYLVDFGAVGHIKKDTMTAAMSNTFVGTIGYMPQEQLFGKVAPETDIYSLGVTMIYLITGKKPSEFQIKKGKIDFKPQANFPEYIKKIIDRMIEPFMENRISSIQEIKRELSKGQNSVSSAEKTVKFLSDYQTNIAPKKSRTGLRIAVGLVIFYLFLFFIIALNVSKGNPTKNIYVDLLDFGVKVWNKWRLQNPEIRNIDLQRINLKGKNLRGINFSGVDLYYADFEGCDLSGSNLNNANLRYANFRGVKISHATLKNSNLQYAKCENGEYKYVNFDNANLYQTDFSGSIFENSIFTKAMLSHCKFSTVNFTQCDFSYADMQHVDIEQAGIKYCNFNYTLLRHAKLKDIKDLHTSIFNKTDFNYVNASDVNFSGCKLKKVKFEHATLNRAKFIKVDFTGSKLNYARFDGADLSYAIFNKIKDLRYCYFEDTNFTGADLSGLNLQYVNFTEVKLENAKLNDSDLSYASINIKYKEYIKNQSVINFDSIRWQE